MSNVGLANPYALAEIALGRRVNWASFPDRDAFVESTFGVPVARLLAPDAANPTIAMNLKALSFDHRELADMVRGSGRLSRTEVARAAGAAEAWFPKVSGRGLARVVSALRGSVTMTNQTFTPAGAEWADPGSFFGEASEFHDPVQGGLGDCYFIAALSAVAWARPHVIAHRTRATGGEQEEFFDRIDFHAGGAVTPIEVTERVPLAVGTHAWYYARSAEPGEIWPAVYEKAFAKWKTSNTTDQPDYGPIAGGWPVQATSELSGLAGTVKDTGSYSDDELWALIRSHCLSYRTFDPMTAWTWCQANPPHPYAGTGIYGYHAYTILGWAYVNNTKYVVLRNPWGHNGPVVDALPGNWSAYDQSFWRSVPLNQGGVFAIPVATFKKYYWQLGWAA